MYRLRNVITGDCYIGSAVDLKARRQKHLWLLGRGSHHSLYLQRAWAKYGAAAFVFECVETCDVGVLLQREQRWLDSTDPPYNMCKTAGSALGLKRSVETRANQSKVLKGKKRSAETKKRISESQQGRVQSALTRERRAAALRGRTRTVKPFLGRKHTDETKRLMSEKAKGRVRSAEHCRRISEANKGRPAWNKGLKASEETRRRQAYAQRNSEAARAASAENLRLARAKRWLSSADA